MIARRNVILGRRNLKLICERRSVQFALSVCVGCLGGASLLLDVSLKAKASFIMVIAFAALLLTVSSPRRVLLFTVAFAVPFYIGKDFNSGLESVSEAPKLGLYLTDCLVVALLMLNLGQLAIDRRTKIQLFPSSTVPAFAWLVASAFSLVNVRNMGVAAIQMIAMGKLFLLYWVVATTIEDDKDPKWLIGGLLLGALCQGLLGSYQWIAGHPLGLSFLGETPQVWRMKVGQTLVYRPAGTLGHANGYAMYLSATMPFALALLFCRVKRLYKAVAGIVLCAGVLGLVLSLSRGGWISFLAVIIIVLALAVRRRRLKVRSTLLIAGATFLILLALTFIGSDLILLRLTSSDYGAAYSRVVLAQGALAIIEDHPLTGVGLKHYTLFVPKYGRFALEAWGKPVVVHNVFLLITAETGLIGLVAFLWFLASLTVQAWRLLSRAPNDTLWMAGVGIFSAFTTLILHGMVDYALLANSRLFTQFWLLAGLVAGLSRNLGCEK